MGNICGVAGFAKGGGSALHEGGGLGCGAGAGGGGVAEVKTMASESSNFSFGNTRSCEAL